jgi:hypothetical protein
LSIRPEPSFPFLHFWRGGFNLHVSEDAADELLGDGDLMCLERSATAWLPVPCVVVAENARGEELLLEGASGAADIVAGDGDVLAGCGADGWKGSGTYINTCCRQDGFKP